jgi:hypothetical protein
MYVWHLVDVLRIGTERLRSSRCGILIMHTTYVHDLYAGYLKPGEQPGQCRLILEWAVHDSFGRLHGGGEGLEVNQGLGRKGPGYADLIVDRCHRRLQASRFCRPVSMVLLRRLPRTTLGG